MTKGAFIEAVTEALRIHDVVGRSEQLALADVSELVCGYFYPTADTTDATICANCGKCKWIHKQTVR